ncbi:hypothetical protein EGT36_29515 [Agrobacterium sp. FDAARGOS_525]|uniref:hypothetical protein n=1 Tax=Agrobacterium sp. FDAARGOS_525 TaxID=2420311 RepID=UPI000F65FA2B|nr:hypothetical protein [Agrobacterium sp. FDAARGOS_525]RSC21580.1 hypothetical protein EGT36_29515 [Agrobacterium sp. FDAARGOS_525]
MENTLKLEDGARSFYQFLSGFGDVVPLLFAVIGLAMCGITGVNLYRMVQREAYAPADWSKTGQIVGFCIGALLGISSVVVYALRRCGQA